MLELMLCVSFFRLSYLDICLLPLGWLLIPLCRVVYAVGMDDADFAKPQIGISPVWWEGKP